MQFSTTALIALFAGVAVSQFPNFPACTQVCLKTTATACNLFDVACLCHDKTYINAATACIATSTCSTADKQAALATFEAACGTS